LRVFGLWARRLGFARLAAAAWLTLSALALSACHGTTISAPSAEPQATAPPVSPEALPPVTETPLAPPGANRVRVALLLPLSGPNGALGNAMLDAAQMALYDVADAKLALMPRDTQGTAEGAAAAARAALGDGARLIIGPLLAAEVEVVKPIARGANVPVLAFSTATQLAGDGTFLMGFLPRQEIERVAAFAHSKGVNRFAALVPRSPYGEIAVEALRAAAQADGATLDRVDYYDPDAQDLTRVVQRFAGVTGLPPGTPPPQPKPPAPGALAPEAPAPPPFDAVLLPEGGSRLRALAPLLPYYDVDPDQVHFLGTGLWDEPGLGTEPALVNGWYAAPPPGARGDFEKRFRDIYRHGPPRLATLAYDATALAAVLARNPSGPDFSAPALTNPSGFAGVDGIFRLRSDGLIQRGLAVLEIKRGGNVVVSPAPTTFQALSN
jgi:branched-chain amino acid transport system substrate-binding protein